MRIRVLDKVLRSKGKFTTLNDRLVTRHGVADDKQRLGEDMETVATGVLSLRLSQSGRVHVK